MFGEAELGALRLRKELLVLKTDIDRLRLASDLQRMGSPEFWLVEAGNVARRHPVLTAALGSGAGLAACAGRLTAEARGMPAARMPACLRNERRLVMNSIRFGNR